MNLIEDLWIPIRRRSGETMRIAPWQLVDGIEDDPIVMVAAPRPDFNGALLEFLIGLIQTEASPETKRGWIGWQQNPPLPEELRKRLARAAPWFELDGDGPRFMQSFESFDGKEKPIGDLVIDDPPFEMIKKNTDHFIKRGRIRGLCPACTAAALFAANAYSPAAGRGHRTSLRGGGPVTTVIAADPAQAPDQATLWHLCWLNVLPRDQFEAAVQGNSGMTTSGGTYPWPEPTRTSEEGEVTTPEDMSPYHVFWGMPRRIRLNQELRHEAACDLCLAEGSLFTAFTVRHGGMNYQGAWVHPLTPYSFAESGAPAPLHMPRGGLGYRNWAALVTGQQEQKTRRIPAVVVSAGVRGKHRFRGKARFLAFGYDVDNAKVRGWYEYAGPVYNLEGDQRTRVRELAGSMIQAANEIAGNLRSALKKAWATAKAPDFAIGAFYQDTEPDFVAKLDRLVSTLTIDPDDDEEKQILNDWHRVLCDASEKLFEVWAEGDDIGRIDPGRIARALLELKRWNWKKTIKDGLLLPEKRPSSKGDSA